MAIERRFDILHDEQSALAGKIISDGFVTHTVDAATKKRSRTFHNEAVENFDRVLNDFDTQRKAYLERSVPINTHLEQMIYNLEAKIDALNNRNLSSDYGYFASAAGAGDPNHHNYLSLPSYYEKIEAGIKGHSEIEVEWNQVKTSAAAVIESYKSFPRVRNEVLEPIKAIRGLFLHDVSANQDSFVFNDFFSSLNNFVRYPRKVDTKVELGEKSIEILRECASDIRKTNAEGDSINDDAAQKAVVLANAVESFAAEIEKKGWQRDFAALIAAKARLPKLPD